jgi:UDP-N-acetylmuramate--alanine ligase
MIGVFNLISNMRRIRHIHMIGIGGAGMGGIAEVLHNLNYKVSGSDVAKNAMTERLSKLGIQVNYAHIAENVEHCDVVVVSSAISKNNIELVMARKRKIPIVPRAEMLSELMRFKHGIAIAGTHGKTTTTGLISSIFAEAKLDPTFVIGGQLNSLGANAKLGTGEYFIAEADESDASFLHLMPMMTVITNIDKDHLGTYNNDFSCLKKAFLDFLHQLPFYGLAVVCLDDEGNKDILSEITRPVITYGFSPSADVRAINVRQECEKCYFDVILPGYEQPLPFQLNIPGKHNILNALAAIIIATDVGIAIEDIRRGFLHFQGTGRRFQVLGKFCLECGEILLVDDYGHHPREVKAIINAVKEGWPEKRLVMVYQPHRYTRTKALFDDFATILSEVDVLFMLDVYSAGEEPIAGADSRDLCSSIRSRGQVEPIFIEDVDKLHITLQGVLKDGDILLMQGAGSISKIAHQLAEKFTTEKIMIA